MGGAVFPPFCLTWGKTMVEVMKTKVNSFKRSHICTAELSAPDPAAGYRWPMPPPETPGHSWQVWASLLCGHCSFFLGPGTHKILFVPSKSPFPQSCVSSGGSMVGLKAISSRGLIPHPVLLHPEPLPLKQATADPYLRRRHSLKDRSDWVSVGLLVCTRFCLRLLSISGGYGVLF